MKTGIFGTCVFAPRMAAPYMAVLIISVLLFMTNPLYALDIGIIGGAGNLAFDPSLKTPLSDETNPKPFYPKLNPLVLATVSGESGFVTYGGGFERSPILRNRLFANIGIDLTYFKVEAGPFIGIFNSKDEIFNPGFSAGMRLEIPGIIFASVRASSSLGNALATTGSYTQKTGELTAGFWVPHVICSANLLTHNYALKEKPNLTIEDSLTRYFFRADVFMKNIPFTIKVDIGYALLKRSYYSQTITGTLPPDLILSTDVQGDEFKFIYLGLEGVYAFNPKIKLFLSGEMPVYSWSTPKMKNPKKGTFLFQAMGGVILSF